MAGRLPTARFAEALGSGNVAVMQADSYIGGEAAATVLLAWYDRHRRCLPWRAQPGVLADPYPVWLSEIMLQQTTVAAVKPYYQRFLLRWPDVGALARAPIEEVMREWAGLGYYSRARNLHACALRVVEVHGGRFPDTEPALRSLPGIGRYTAAAIAAIAFGRRAVVVDSNVERVIARLFAIETPLPSARRAIHAAATRLTPDERSGDFAQAMMDLGSTVCTPRQPLCALCPLAAGCRARASGSPERFPSKPPRSARPLRQGAIFHIVRDDGCLLVGTRPAKGLLGGMSELPGTVPIDGLMDLTAVPGQAPLRALFRHVAGTVEHAFTHVAWRLHVFCATVPLGTRAPPPLRWVRPELLDREAFPTVMRKVLAHARALQDPASAQMGLLEERAQ